jgi:hypothetical protein
LFSVSEPTLERLPETPLTVWYEPIFGSTAAGAADAGAGPPFRASHPIVTAAAEVLQRLACVISSFLLKVTVTSLRDGYESMTEP